MPVRAKAPALVVDLAEDHVDITTGFNGAHLVLFGVREKTGEIAVVLHGPRRSAVVRKKEQILGAWLNRHSVTFKDAFSYYDYAVSAPSEELLKPADLNKYHIDPASFSFETDEKNEERVKAFQKALVRNKQIEKLYPREAKEVEFLSDRLFRSEFYLTANMPPGEYVIHTYLINNKKIIEKNKTKLKVAQVGSSAALYTLAFDHSFLYAMLCLAVALIAGFGIHLLRRS